MITVLPAGGMYVSTYMDEPSPSPEIRQWAATWQLAGEALEQIKRYELARLQTSDALAHLADAFDLARRQAKPTTTSGLVEQQRVFARLRA